jgi:ribosomal protein S11
VWGREDSVGNSGWSGRERGYRMVNKVQKLYIHVYKCKNDTIETISRTGGREIKDKSGGSEFKYMFDTL